MQPARSILLAGAIALGLFAVAAPVKSAPPDVQERTREAVEEAERLARDAMYDAYNWAARIANQIRNEAQALRQSPPHPQGVQLLSDDVATLAWVEPDGEMPTNLVLLIHGLDEPGDIWDDLAPALHDAGFDVARFEYPNDQHPARSAEQLDEALRALSGAGTEEISIVAHSMGGLVVRDALSRPEFDADARPDVSRIITVGTPWRGSPFAGLQAVSEARERISRWWSSPDRNPAHLSHLQSDGDGEAANALTPGSPFLEDLAARPLPDGPRWTVIMGRIAPPGAGPIGRVTGAAPVRRWIPAGLLNTIDNATADAFETLGDGVVPIESARLEIVDDIVELEADHRAMLRMTDAHRAAYDLTGAEFDEPPAIEIILDRLASDD